MRTRSSSPATEFRDAAAGEADDDGEDNDMMQDFIIVDTDCQAQDQNTKKPIKSSTRKYIDRKEKAPKRKLKGNKIKKKTHFDDKISVFLDNKSPVQDVRIIWNPLMRSFSDQSLVYDENCSLSDAASRKKSNDIVFDNINQQGADDSFVSIQYLVSEDTSSKPTELALKDIDLHDKVLLASFLLPDNVSNLAVVRRNNTQILSKINISNSPNSGSDDINEDNRYLPIQSSTSVADLLQLIHNRSSANMNVQLDIDGAKVSSDDDGVHSQCNVSLAHEDSNICIMETDTDKDPDIVEDIASKMDKNMNCYRQFLFMKTSIAHSVRDKTISAFLALKKVINEKVDNLGKSSSSCRKNDQFINLSETRSNQNMISRNDSCGNQGFSLSLQLFLSETAFELCSPLHLSSSTKLTIAKNPSMPACTMKRRRHTDRLKSIARVSLSNLLLAIGSIFPDSIITDLVLNCSTTRSSRSTEGNITAKQIYALTDNVQLKRAMERNILQNKCNELRMHVAQPQRFIDDVLPMTEFGTRVSPLRDLSSLQSHGLVPKLRPYQEYAVRWMLQREIPAIPGTSTCASNEWQLAWYVLPVVTEFNFKKPSIQPRLGCQSQCLDLLTQIEFLPDYMGRQKQSVCLEKNHSIHTLCKSQRVLLVNPFTGWLAQNIEQAYAMTYGHINYLHVPLDNGNQLTAKYVGQHVKGGILAESMGLGKTVEVLACIIANPFRLPASIEVWDASANPSSSQGQTSALLSETANGDNNLLQELAPSVSEQWIDDEVLGSCICGDLICFSKKDCRSVVVCNTCKGLMHRPCAMYNSIDNLATSPEQRIIRYRKTFSYETIECFVCEDNRCPCCVACNPMKIQSRATLIITPPAIISQWKREIETHTRMPEINGRPLKVCMYDGMQRLIKDKNTKLMHPSMLADADVVLMTFDTLMNDLSHSDDNRYVGTLPSKYLRQRKVYRVVPSPLTSVRWWRVCLDEAQHVETPTSGAALMARKLESEHLWCVTGTPIGRGKFDDLYGLLLFLRLKPFSDDKLLFKRCVLDLAYRNVDQRINHLLSDVFWRSTKSDEVVREQLGVPEQIEKKVFLQFSSIERHFYNSQLEETLSAAGDIAERKKCVSGVRLNRLADQLHKLRAACCHPQVGASGIGLSRRRTRKTTKRSKNPESQVVEKSFDDNGINSRVMTMNQILNRFIDDAKQKCEEDQRLAILHTNGMAATSRLMVEAKSRGIENISESDDELLQRSCKLYLESLSIADANAAPTLILGELQVCGSIGFRTQKPLKKGSVRLEWTWTEADVIDKNVWARLDFSLGPARKITGLQIRDVAKLLPENSNFPSGKLQMLYPKDCILQNVVHGGEYLDVHSFSLPCPTFADVASTMPWDTSFRASKSKSWRLCIKSFHENPFQVESIPVDKDPHYNGYCVGFCVDFFEATIASDPLQSLHCLHNAALTFSSLLEHRALHKEADIVCLYNTTEAKQRISSMRYEAEKIESLYVQAARLSHNSSKLRLTEASGVRQRQENELIVLTKHATGRQAGADCWDDNWWIDFLGLCTFHLNDFDQARICDKVLSDLDEIQGRSSSLDSSGNVFFPPFATLHGFRAALEIRVRNIRTGIGKKSASYASSSFGPSAEKHNDKNFPNNAAIDQREERRFKCAAGANARCIKSIMKLDSFPTSVELLENSNCRICKADWLKTGPVCRHCKIGEELQDMTPDPVTMAVLKSLSTILRGQIGASVFASAGTSLLLEERAKAFFDLLDTLAKEKGAAWRMWRVHLDLLNDLDELSQCKTSMRLTYDDEDLTNLAFDQQGALVHPIDVCSRYHDHAAKQAMFLGALKRSKGTLQYLKNQRSVHADSSQENVSGQCMVCLSSFEGEECAVLQCGHRICLSPCLEKFRLRNSTSIYCPFRCVVKTAFQDVLIASEKSHEDGSRNNRTIKGSFGTKVTRLVCDILDVIESGDKSIVFSQWDDMLDICEYALTINGISFVRASSRREIGDCAQKFLSPDCFVYLLNVKNGAEGLTVVEATHVFMVEPLLNPGLDSQAISRVHRIGQNRTTYVVRYLIEDTIEIKIDMLRSAHQDDQLEDSISSGKKSTIKAGGIDGGFQSEQELFDLLKPASHVDYR